MTSGKITWGHKWDTELYVLEQIIIKLRLINNKKHSCGVPRTSEYKDMDHNSYHVEMAPGVWEKIKPIIEQISDLAGFNYTLLKERPNVRVGFVQSGWLRHQD